MTEKKILMADYWSVCDKNKKPLGHGAKAANEYYEFIKDSYIIYHYVNDSMLSYINNPLKKTFKHSMHYADNKVVRILKHFFCLLEAYSRGKNSTLWFYAPNFYLFIFILLIHKKERRIAVNVYEEYAGHRIKQWIFKQALKKIDIVFVTNKKLLKIIPKGIFIPDYPYKDTYKKYLKTVKKEQVVCLGTMHEKKLLEDAVSIFSKNGYRLFIIGQFASEERFRHLCEIKNDNVIIQNQYIEPDDYYQLLAESKFCLIPYDAAFYKNRTSGVLQECLFVDTIPISHKDILDFSNISGIGYECLSELINIDLEKIDINKWKNTYEAERNNSYNYEIIKTQIIKALK